MSAGLSVPPPSIAAIWAGVLFHDLIVLRTAPETRMLSTRVDYETGRNHEPLRQMKEVEWEVALPDGCTPFLPFAASSLDELSMAWIGWRSARTIAAISVFHEAPIEVARAGTAIEPPLVPLDGTMQQFFWRDGDGATLMRHVFRGPRDGETSVSTERVTWTPGRPLLTALAADAEGIAAAWVVRLRDRLAAAVAWIDGNGAHVAASPLHERLTVTMPQRIAVHIGRDRVLRFTFVARDSRHETDLLVACSGDRATGRFTADSEPFPELPSPPAATAALYLHGVHHEQPLLFARDSGGALLNVAGKRVRRVRTASREAFPLLPSRNDCFLLEDDGEGLPRLAPMRWDTEDR